MQVTPSFKRFYKITGSLLVLGLSFTSIVQAKSLSTVIVNTVDMQAIQKARKVETVTQQLQNQIAPQEKKIQQLASEYKIAEERFEKETPTMEDKARKEAEVKLDQLRQNLQEEERKFQKTVIDTRYKLYKWVIDTIQSVSERLSFNIVIPKEQTLYADPALDITAQVIAALDKSTTTPVTSLSKNPRKSK